MSGTPFPTLLSFFTPTPTECTGGRAGVRWRHNQVFCHREVSIFLYISQVRGSVARSSRARTLRYYRLREGNTRVLEFLSLALKKREKPARASRLIYLHGNNKQQVFNQQTAALAIILQQWLNYRTFLRTFDFKWFIRSSNETNSGKSGIIINSKVTC